MSSEMLSTLSLATEDIFQVHSQKQPVANIPVVDFRSQLNTEFVTFIFFSSYFGCLSPLGRGRGRGRVWRPKGRGE